VRGRYEKVAEVPYVFKARIRGRSKLGLKEMIHFVSLLFKLRTSGENIN
jgi:hypothetical protein